MSEDRTVPINLTLMLFKAVDLLYKCGLLQEFIESLEEPLRENFIKLLKIRPIELGGPIEI